MYKRFSVLNVLCSVVNSSNHSSVDYCLAYYFLENFDKLSDLNIHDVANDCYCTRQSVRRFCQKIGFPNFISLKNYLIRYNHLRWEQLKIYDTTNFQQSMPLQINDAINNINEKFSSNYFSEVIDAINENDCIIFFVDESIKSLIFQFQKAMIFNNKIIKIISNGVSGASILDSIFDSENISSNNSMNSISSNDLIITISLSGNFASVIDEIISKVDAKKFLITNYCDIDDSSYDCTFFLADNYDNYYGNNAYTIFGLNYFLENITNLYIQSYGNIDLVKDKRALDEYISGGNIKETFLTANTK